MPLSHAFALFSGFETERQIIEVVRKAGGHKHIMNLGHGVMPATPEENVAHFFNVCKTVDQRMGASA